MRRLALAGIVFAAVLTALPTSARTFRVDQNRCDEVGSFQLECWEGVPSGATPALPVNGETSFTSTTGLAAAKFATSSFELTAFDYAQFVADNPLFFNDPNNVISAPTRQISRGLSRPDNGGGSDFLATDNPLLRIYWFFDYDLYAAFPNIFSDKSDFFDPNRIYFGVELIFDGQGFDIFGLEPGGFAYSSSRADGQDLWGPNQPCDRFNNAGVCVGSPGAVPEPSSIALLGLGFLALVVRLRAGRRTETYLA